MTALVAERLSARYAGQSAASCALESIDLDVKPGQRLLLLGPNGAGKSTFIRVFAGLMRPAAGSALIAGVSSNQARASVGVVSHSTYLYDELSALENLRLYGELYGVGESGTRGTALLERLGIGQLADVQVGKLSRGQQQRVAIARALVHDPPVLLLDEPDTGLDVAAFAAVSELVIEGGRTLVLTTHNLATGLRLGTRVVILAGGHIVYEQADASSADAPDLAERLARAAR